ncbi:hypothetical protein [Paenibacillus sanguinis]|uniref:hypothetical protein n=1 Tax=Paenibacillus sanguinis TaxID=225906 RepID=UPI00036A85F1|nr:hypothetical protein [Paenibacillus sanguinis]
MFKRSVTITLLFAFALMLIAPGCTGQKAAKDALSLAVSKIVEADSYVLESQIEVLSVELDLETAEKEVEEAEPTGSSELSAWSILLPWLKDADIRVRQIYHKEPAQAEALLEIKLQGKMAITVTIPLIITPDKLYVQLPSTPLLPMPEELAGQFITLDFKELAQQSGQAATELPQVSAGEVQNLGSIFMAALLAGYDGDTYFKYVGVEQAALPEEVPAKQVVQFAVSNNEAKQAREVLKGQVLPEVRSIWEQKGYPFMPEALADALVINTVTVHTAIDEQNYPVYTSGEMDLTLDAPNAQESARIVLRLTRQYSQINEQPPFEIGIPTNPISTKQWQEAMHSFGY